MAYKGSTGGSTSFTSIKPAHLKKKKKTWASYRAHLSGPLKVTRADGTVEVVKPLTATEINKIVYKNLPK